MRRDHTDEEKGSLSKEAVKTLSVHCAKSGVVDLDHQGILSSQSLRFLWSLTSLTRLTLEHNELSELAIPKDASLPNLKTVSLRYNQIKVLPEFFSHVGPEFEMLDVRNNQIEELPAEFRLLMTKQELVILSRQPDGQEWYYSEGPRSFAPANPNWSGWHGKTPVSGNVYGFKHMSYWGRRPYHLRQIQVSHRAISGFRMRFEDNPAEQKLRELLGLEGEAKFRADRVESFLNQMHQQQMMEAQTTVDEAPDYKALGEQRQEQKLERERQKKNADKSIKREEKRKTQQRLLVDEES